MSNEIKLATDLVNLTNTTDKDVEFHFNGEPIKVSKGGFSQLVRTTAEHGVRATAIMGQHGSTAVLKIDELPLDQRSKEGMSKAAEGLAKANVKIKEQEDLIQTLLDENKALREKVEKLEKRLARS